MENNLGKCFKLLRESKGLSQKEIAGEVISIAQLSRFERGVSNINADTLYQCLENMNVSIAEFQCVCRNYLQNQTLLFQDEVAKAYIEKNTLIQRENMPFPTKYVRRFDSKSGLQFVLFENYEEFCHFTQSGPISKM